jgi:hypothetical protein
MGNQYVASVKALPADRLASKRDEVKGLNDVNRYLARWKIVPADYAPKAAIEQLIKDQGWDKKK